MDLSTIPDHVWIERGPDMFRVLVGGQHVWDIILDHWQGMSWREIEAKHNVPRETARRWVTVAKQQLRQAGCDADAIVEEMALSIQLNI